MAAAAGGGRGGRVVYSSDTSVKAAPVSAATQTAPEGPSMLPRTPPLLPAVPPSPASSSACCPWGCSSTALSLGPPRPPPATRAPSPRRLPSASSAVWTGARGWEGRQQQHAACPAPQRCRPAQAPSQHHVRCRPRRCRPAQERARHLPLPRRPGAQTDGSRRPAAQGQCRARAAPGGPPAPPPPRPRRAGIAAGASQGCEWPVGRAGRGGARRGTSCCA